MICKVVFDKIDYGNAYELFDMPPVNGQESH